MPQVYKIFFDDRVIVLTDKITKTYEKNDGLFLKNPKKEQIAEICGTFESLVRFKTLYILSNDVEKLYKKFQSNFKLIEAAGGIVKRNDNKILLIFRRGKWDLPKGKLEKNEKYDEAAIREVEEETGLKKVKLNDHLLDTYHIYYEKGIRVLKKTVWYEMSISTNQITQPQTEEDISEIRWIDLCEVDEVMKNTFESVKEIFIELKNK